MLELGAYPAVRRRQGVEGKRGIQVVFGVERHVPHLPSNHRIRQGCTGVAGAIGIKATAAVLRQHRQPQERLANGQGQQPIPEQKTTAIQNRYEG